MLYRLIRVCLSVCEMIQLKYAQPYYCAAGWSETRAVNPLEEPSKIRSTHKYIDYALCWNTNVHVNERAFCDVARASIVLMYFFFFYFLYFNSSFIYVYKKEHQKRQDHTCVWISLNLWIYFFQG